VIPGRPAAPGPPAAVTSGRPLVELRRLTKIYREGDRERIVLREVDAAIHPGELVVVVGRSGSGKSTLLNLIGGIDRPTAGEVVVDGVVLTRVSEEARTRFRRRHLGFVFQFFNLIPSLSAIENLELPMLIAGTPEEERRARAENLLETVGLKQKGFKRPEELSGGEQQRVAVCLALVNNPSIILADEPTGNLDSANSKIIADLLINLAKHEGKTVIVASHDPKVVEAFPRMYHMRDGVIQRAA
jgi:putative ABC transport system ATP-binding protein